MSQSRRSNCLLIRNVDRQSGAAQPLRGREWKMQVGILQESYSLSVTSASTFTSMMKGTDTAPHGFSK
jgi:hypothetical protein